MKHKVIYYMVPLLAVLFLSLKNKTSNTNDNTIKALSAKEINFYGINYQHLALIHEFGFMDKNGNTKCAPLKNKYFKEWNLKFIIEDYKFDVINFFNVDHFDRQLAYSDSLNQMWYNEGNCIKNTATYKLSQSDIQSTINEYPHTKYDIGVVIIAESLSKKLDQGSYYFVYFDTHTHEILYQKNYISPPGGMGFSAYWINSLYECLKKHDKMSVKDLKKAYK